MLLGLATSIVKRSPDKKVDKKKLLPAAKGTEQQKALPGTAKPSSIIVRPKVSVARKIKVTNYKVASADEGGIRGGALVYDGLVKRLDSLVKNTNTLSQIVSDQYSNEVSKNTAARRQTQKDAQNEREAEAEAKAEKKQEEKSFGLGIKKLDLLDGVFGTLKRLFFAKAIMEFLNFFSDPEKTKPIFDFLNKHFTTILIGTIGALGTLVLLPLLGPGSIMLSAIGMIGSLAMTLGGIAVSVALSPGGRLILAAMALRGLYYNNAGGVRGFLEGTMLKGIAAGLRMKYGDANFQKGAFTTKLRDNYGRIASQAERDKMTAEEKNTARFLAMYDKELEKKDKADPKKLKMLEEQIVIQGKPLSFWYSRFTQHGMDGLPQTSLSRRLYKDNAKAADALSQSLSKPQQSGLDPSPSVPLVSGTSRITRDMFGRRGFGTRDNIGSGRNPGGHTGRDVGLPEGTPLSVVPAGTVIDVGIMGDANDHSPKKDNGGYGNFVAIRLDDGRVIKSNHHSKILVKVGDRVGLQADGSVKPIGLIGDTGLSFGSHMHLDLGSGYIPGTASVTGLVDPDQFILSGGVVTGGRSASAQASGISRSAPYEPGAEPPVAVIPQRPAPATPATAPTKMSSSILPGDNTASALNNYYRNQILGAMNRQ